MFFERATPSGAHYQGLGVGLLLLVVAAVVACAGGPDEPSSPAVLETRLDEGPQAAMAPHDEDLQTQAQGVVVTKIGVGSARERAGLQEGDVLLEWRRLPNPPTNSQEAQGKLTTAFDWMWLETEQAARGVVEISGERDGEPKVFRIEPGRWEIWVRPTMPQTVLKATRAAWKLRENGAYVPAARALQETAELVRSSGNESLHTWILLKAAQTWAKEMARAKGAEAREARETIETALASAREPVAQAALWKELAFYWQARRDFDRSISCYQREIETWRQISGSEGLGVSRSRYAFAEQLLQFLEQLPRAEKLLYEALETQNKFIPGSLPLADTMSVLGRVLLQQGDFQLAEEYLERALEIQQNLDPEGRGMAATLTHLGLLANSRGDLEVAVQYHQRALALREKNSFGDFSVATSLDNLGTTLYQAGDLEEAEECFDRSLEIWEELSPGSLSHAITLVNLGSIAHERHFEELSSRYIQSALEIYERLLPNSLYLASGLSSRGLLALGNRDLEGAMDYYRRALQIQERLAPGSLAEAASLNSLGRVASAQGRVDAAVRYFSRAVRSLESQIARLGGTNSLKARFLSNHADFYRDLVSTNLALNENAEAFHVLERSRAQSFLSLLAERELLFEIDLPKDLAERRQSLLVRHNRVYLQYIESGQFSPEGRETLENQLAAVHRELDEIREEVRRTSPRFAALQYPQPLDLEGVRRALDPGTVLLSYSVGPKNIVLFLVNSEGRLTVETLPIGEEKLRDEVTLMRNLIAEGRAGSEVGSFRGDHLQQVSRRLYDSLIAPVADELEGAERLLILPDSALHTLPWGALVRDLPESEGERSWQYLIEWKPVHLALSATVYAELRSTRAERLEQEQPAPVLEAAFGDPQIPERFRRDDPDSIEDVRVRSAAERGFDFRPLPATRLEVEGITRLFGSEARAYLGAEATEERAKSVGAEARYLHFATHGHLDERFPLNSALVLSIPETFREDRDNGLLQVWEIFERVRFDADLVVLSACESALGEELGGEGLIGLTRAFQYAGARSVVASLWQVADASTAELMLRFYRHLREGQTKDEALRVAQLELIRGPIDVMGPGGVREEVDASAPYAWAAFQLYGDWR